MIANIFCLFDLSSDKFLTKIFSRIKSFQRFYRLIFSDNVHLKELLVEQTQIILDLIERNNLL